MFRYILIYDTLLNFYVIYILKFVLHKIIILYFIYHLFIVEKDIDILIYLTIGYY